MGGAQPILASGLTRMMWQTSTTTCPHGRFVRHTLHLQALCRHHCSSGPVHTPFCLSLADRLILDNI